MRTIKAPSDMQVGSYHHIKGYGEAVILEYNSSNDVKIRFIDTGTEISVQAGNLRRGMSIKDKNKRTVYGVGFLGYGKYGCVVDGEITDNYKVWAAMIRRCYSEESLLKRPTYHGCTVCDDWHNFQNFSEWYYENYPFDGNRYEIDKDIKIEGNKLYSPDTCLFVTPFENTEKASAKKHLLESPDGEIIEVYNMKKFCREMELNDADLRKVRRREIKHHKGWKLLEARV